MHPDLSAEEPRNAPVRMRRKRLSVVSRAATPRIAAPALDGYVRVSHVGGRGGETFISPELQEERIRAYARSRGLAIGIVHHELDRSGADRERPLFSKALARVARRESGGIVVAKIDRFARSALDALAAVQQIEEAGGVFISVEDGLDSSTPFGRAMMTILLALAELELTRVRDVWDSAQARAVARGMHTSTRTPVGYRRADDGRLVPDARMAPLVEEAFRRRAAGATYREIAERLSDESREYGGGAFRAARLAKMLKSRVYVGEAYYGRYRNPGAHRPIVPMRLWLAAQSTSPNHFPHPAAETLLSGLLRCAGCSHLLASSWTRTSADGRGGKRLASYGCRRDRHTEPCPNPARVRATEIEALALEHFFTMLHSRRRRAKPDLDRLEDELAAADGSLAALLNEQQTFSADRQERVAIAAHFHSTAEKSRRLRVLIRRAAFDELPPAKRLEKLWPEMTTAARRQALGSAFDAIVVEQGATELARRVQFVRAGDSFEELPRQGRPGPTRAWSRSS